MTKEEHKMQTLRDFLRDSKPGDKLKMPKSAINILSAKTVVSQQKQHYQQTENKTFFTRTTGGQFGKLWLVYCERWENEKS